MSQIPPPTPADREINLEHAWNCSGFVDPPEAIRSIIRLLAEARRERDAMRKALEWYADGGNYHWCGAPMTPFVDGKPDPRYPEKDFGRIAAAALAPPATEDRTP